MINPTVIIWTLVCALVLDYTIRIFQSYRRLCCFPGPLFNAISYWPMFLARWKGNDGARAVYAQLSTRYGKLVRIGPNELLTSDAGLITEMSAPKSSYERSSWYTATRLDPYHDMMGSVLDKTVHASLKSKTAAGYRGTDDPGLLETRLDEGIEALLMLLREKYVSASFDAHRDCAASRVVDLGRLIELYAMDARSRMSFNEPIGMVQRDEDVFGLIRTSKLAINLIQFCTDIPLLASMATNNLVLRLLGPKPTDRSGFGKIMGIAQEHINARVASDGDRKHDLLGSFLHRGLGQRSAAAEMMFPLIAGSDTAAKAIKSITTLVLSISRVYDKLSTEIRDHTRSVSRPVTYQETKRMSYLQAVIWESLRLRPPFTGLLMKQSGPNGGTYEDKFIPPGTRVAHDIWSVTHDRSVFGHDANDFRPERWLEADTKQKATMERYTELIFGTGRWQCAGKVVALMELHKLVVELFRRYHLVLIAEGPFVVITERPSPPV